MHTGILAGVRPCGIIVFLSELFISESKTQVYGALHSFYKLVPTVASKIGKHSCELECLKHCGFSSCTLALWMLSYFMCLQNCPHAEYVCYDDGCHLRKFARNPNRADISRESQILAKQHIVVDKMHMRGHIDQWCKLNCDPAEYPYLNDVRFIIIKLYRS